MRTIGLDYGEKRIGVAVSDSDGVIAMPLRVVDATSKKKAVEEIRAIVAETEAEKIIVGMPINMNGTRGEMAVKAEQFVERLRSALGVVVEEWDERLSTAAAERHMREADLTSRRRKEIRDKMAAQVILQGYLDMKAGEELTADERRRTQIENGATDGVKELADRDDKQE